MSKDNWLRILRRCNNIETLEKVIDKKNYELTDRELSVFWGAADHRLAELITGRLYDKVPTEIWKYVR
ncbi:hemolysin expression modulator Hha [Apirhabdus apintestini]|uniref:hemolysin expression modulator Hha n=1 Tax=Erwinia sp. HR93 TaxID=3094840 RepID=UPI002ADEE0EF|nr:hemolysin expression modulator Hha [Erwinia sp. HR93]MEA1062953.1 hemolysin expression modulator Hha [Erwinia sp. HR93]WPM84824.1 hemolysin expression modulator Hha [Enterobacteriaceae bacterium CA-0114]